ncbi:MAG TPA: sensor domain-containing diguanylate cyclase [Anaerolineales bacterium]|nr:sensor domain-containing diguanylate cyclase [Anaerolineales bacterium]
MDNNFYKDLIDHLFDGVYFVDRDRNITYWNQGAERITGYCAADVIGHSCRDNLLNHVSANGVLLCLTSCPLAACMEDGKPREADVFLHHASGHRIPVRVRAAPLRDANGEIIGAVETFNNNTNIVNLRSQLRELQHTVKKDTLTGVGNRAYLEGRLRAIFAEFEQEKAPVGLLFIDVDHFKQFNDTFGHELGDKVLQMVADTLSHNVRVTDAVGRWGGEEFLVILYDIETEQVLAALANKLRALVAHSSLSWQEHQLSVTISVGATLLQPQDTPETFVRRADLLMYKSKQAGRDRVTIG